jgi:hypothetical protein
MSKDGVIAGQAASMLFDPDRRVAIVAFSNAIPDLHPSTQKTARALCTKRFRRHLFPRLLVVVSFCLPSVERSPGTNPSQAAHSRPFLKAAQLPNAAPVAHKDLIDTRGIAPLSARRSSRAPTRSR